MDRISKSLLDEFSSELALEGLPESSRFEHLAAYLAVSRHYAEAFDPSDLVTGSGGDTGIDGVAIIANGKLVTDIDEVEELVDANGYADASFIFVQAESSASFDSSKIGQFGFGVGDFFSELPKLPRNQKIVTAAEIMSAVYARSSKFKRGNPTCKLYYVTTGKWVGDKNLEVRRSAVVEDLVKLSIFRDVTFTPVDADGIQKLYREAKNAISREFTFVHRAVVPEMPGVDEAHIGLVPAKEFLSLIEDGAGGILKSIFYDNVRDWQDYNPVNTEMRETLESISDRARFVLMNNGVTIIAKSVRPTANKFFIEDYQIVNGCQTSHVLFDQRNLLDDTVFIPLRLIATRDDHVVAAVVKATNRQTEVKQEQLIALSEFQKKIEAYFASFEAPKRLFYERRSRQYSATLGVEKTRVITPTALIRAYASMFLEEPHRTTRSYRLLLDRVGKDIFGADHRIEPYYLAASALYRLDYLFRNLTIDARLKPARYHILMAARILASPGRPPRSNSNEMARYSDAISSVIWNMAEVEQLFDRSAKLVNDVANGSLDRDSVRTEPFTDAIRDAAYQRAL